MPRKGPVPKRELLPDSRFNSVLVTKLINKVMLKGKKSLAERVVYSALQTVEEKSGKHPVEALEQALEKCKPLLEVRPRRIGGATYQIPIEVSPERSLSLGLKWLVNAARKREGRTMEERLAAEILEALQGLGGAVKKKEEAHKMAEANKAFASYRW
ncbi:MAG: 30S ribosomal protein S7 [Caldiserica bacterium]|jgi:small subunit ribosomal protein S7|nr:30S ribosomal protein S7 [Caldisericota bacterium]MDH7561748.1 30S ribosomal protein S7 [Caldisericota bacterium]